MTADPTTLSLADLAAAVVALGAHRKLQCIIDGNHRVVVNSYGADLDLLLTAANRLPGVVAECERLTAEAARLRGLLDRAASMLEANTDKSSRRFVAAAIRKEAAGE